MRRRRWFVAPRAFFSYSDPPSVDPLHRPALMLSGFVHPSGSMSLTAPRSDGLPPFSFVHFFHCGLYCGLCLSSSFILGACFAWRARFLAILRLFPPWMFSSARCLTTLRRVAFFFSLLLCSRLQILNTDNPHPHKFFVMGGGGTVR